MVRRRALSGAATVAIGLLLLTPGAARAEIIDRVFAVVGGSLVTQSDVLAAIRLGLQKPPAGAANPLAGVLERLIERQLMLAEVERYAPPPPPDAEVTLRLEQVRLSFAEPAAFQKALADSGMDEDQLRRHLRDDLRIANYLQQRFGSPVQPSEQEILAYYTAHPELFTRDGVRLSFDAAHDAARAALIADARAKLVAEWVEGLRRRSNVSVLYAAK